MTQNPIRTVVERIRAREAAKLGRVAKAEVVEPQKTKAELQDELDAAGVEYPKSARKADLEALLPSDTTPDLGEVVAEDMEEEKPN